MPKLDLDTFVTLLTVVSLTFALYACTHMKQQTCKKYHTQLVMIMIPVQMGKNMIIQPRLMPIFMCDEYEPKLEETK